MNPPFSDREKMPKEMQDKLKANTRINVHSGNLVNLWGYFLVLADMLLKENGILGAVVPINFARGKATKKIRDYILSRHSIKYLIKPVGDIAFSEGSALKDILIVSDKRKSNQDSSTKIVYVKKSIKNIGSDNISQFARIIQREDFYSDDNIDVFTIDNKELEENKNNLMHFLWANSFASYELIKTFTSNLSGKKLIDFPEQFVFDCFNSSGFKGLIEATFITNPLDEKSRIARAYMILSNKSKSELNIRIKKTGLTFNIPTKCTKKGLRTLTGVRNFNIANEHDYFISKKFPAIKEIIRFSKVDNKIYYNWEEVEKRSKDKFVNLFIARRFRLNSPNTSFIAFYSDQKIITADVFKIIPHITKTDAKVLCLFFNSIFNIIQILTNQEATTGGYSTVRETDLLEFRILNYKQLTNNEKHKLLSVFNDLKKIKFPSFMEQLESRFEGRIILDKSILTILGYSKSEINKILPKLYDLVLKELTEK